MRTGISAAGLVAPSTRERHRGNCRGMKPKNIKTAHEVRKVVYKEKKGREKAGGKKKQIHTTIP